MSHPNQINFCTRVKTKFPDYFTGIKVLDVGSLNVNGSIKEMFTNCTYIGVDIAQGNNVDVVSKIHEYQTDILFDVVCSCEMFEHDMYLPLSLKKMVDLLKPKGLMFFTCATNTRLEHGTINRNPGDSPLTSVIDDWKTYYKNVSKEDIQQIINISAVFSSYEFSGDSEDLYFWGIKR